MRISLLIIVAAICLSVRSDMDYTCVPGVLPVIGVTIPRGDIFLLIGDPLTISCLLNPAASEGLNSSHLTFFRNTQEVDRQYITIVNSTAIQLKMYNMTYSDAVFTCQVRYNATSQPQGVCNNKVKVGYPPQEVKNFSCISINWENLTCTWKKPANTIDTSYSLVYNTIPSYRRSIPWSCPMLFEEMCFWNLTTDPQYRNAVTNFSFRMKGANVLKPEGTTWTYVVNNYARVIPGSPVNLHGTFKSESQCNVEWSVPYPLQTFPPGLKQRLKYKSKWDEDWKTVDTNDLDLHSEDYSMSITLDRANTDYYIIVQMRSVSANDVEEMWSKPGSIILKSKPAVPSSPPKTSMSSFETAGRLQSRDVFVYWQNISADQENGDQFGYRVISVYEGERQVPKFPDKLTNAYAHFTGLSYKSYKFIIASVNQVGNSAKTSQVYVPSREEMPGQPRSFTKIDFSNGVYELSWKPPKRDAVSNYTVFWCTSKLDRPYQCDGHLDWLDIPGDQFAVNVTLPPTLYQYQFAISANSDMGSSGMMWATCTVIYNRVVDKIKEVEVNGTGPNEIMVGWRLDCSDRIGIITGYRIHYCTYDGASNCTGVCSGAERNITINKSDIDGYKLSALEPYTKYMIMVSVITRAGEGRASDPVCNITLSTAPSSPPHTVAITNVTKNSMTVSWLPPLQMNGVLDHFVVIYNRKTTNVEPNALGDGRYFTVLEDLGSFTNYTVQIEACTVKCSQPSAIISAITQVGEPGIVPQPTVKFINSTLVSVSWEKPTPLGGLVNYYQIKATVLDENNKSPNATVIKDITGMLVMFPIQDCYNKESQNTFSFQVRAVNLGAGGSALYGPWSKPNVVNCYSGGPTTGVWVAIITGGIVGGISLIIMLAFLARRMWVKLKEMRKVKLRLPPGLANPDVTLGGGNNMKSTNLISRDGPIEHKIDTALLYNRLNSQGSDDDRERHLSGDTGFTAVDDESLLQDKDESPSRNPSGASSGCEHDSVSSAATTGTQLSTESSTEASPDVVFVDPNQQWRPSSLRFRNPSRDEPLEYCRIGLEAKKQQSSLPNLESAGKGGSTSSEGSLPAYSRVGLTDNKPTGGYVTLPKVTYCNGHGGGYVTVSPESTPSPPTLYCKVGEAAPSYLMMGAGYVQMPPNNNKILKDLRPSDRDSVVSVS